MNHLNKYLTVIILFLIMAIFILFALFRQISTNKKIANKIEAQWQGEILTQEKIKILEQSINEVSKEMDSFKSHFARSSDIVPFLDTIEQLATSVSAKATINTVDITEDPPSLLIGVHAVGSFESVYKFMTLLENASYELQIMTFDLKKEGTSADSGPVNWSVTLRIKVVSFSSR
ncbi:MAG: hypothetical protein M3Q34_03345 [bacterium]|nr:hypothetical protein [bacterium]